MYLHIGKNFILNINNVLGIFDIDSLKKTGSYDNIINKIQNIEDLSDDKQKTLIITKENENYKIYISNILSTTIAARCKW